jgi:hypothetical protein
MPGARCARSRACSVVNTRVSHHGHTGTTRHSPRNGFNDCFVLSPVTGLFCHRHQRNCFRQLDTSVGASGPHDFTVRLNTARLRRIRVHRTRPAAVTIACRPSVGLRLSPPEGKNCCVLNMLWITPSARVPAVSRRDFTREFIGRAWPSGAGEGLARCTVALRWRRAVRPSCGLDAAALRLPAAPSLPRLWVPANNLHSPQRMTLG